MHVDRGTGHMLGWAQRNVTRTGAQSSFAYKVPSFWLIFMLLYTVCPRKSGYERMCQYITKYVLNINVIIIL